MANRVTIQIAGQQYTMLADETVEYMNEVAELAQQTVVECGGSTAFASTRALALATVNLADEYIKAKTAAEAAEAKCRALEAENTAPVSYTHLDVYKRQGFLRSARCLRRPVRPARLRARALRRPDRRR